MGNKGIIVFAMGLKPLVNTQFARVRFGSFFMPFNEWESANILNKHARCLPRFQSPARLRLSGILKQKVNKNAKFS